jgi:hypothetical protein
MKQPLRLIANFSACLTISPSSLPISKIASLQTFSVKLSPVIRHKMRREKSGNKSGKRSFAPLSPICTINGALREEGEGGCHLLFRLLPLPGE